MLIVLFGGTSFEQVGWTFAVTLMTSIAAGSLGAIVALWREKTFQALALVAMCIVWNAFSAIRCYGTQIIHSSIRPLGSKVVAPS